MFNLIQYLFLRKLAANRDRREEQYEATEDVPTQPAATPP